MTVDTAIDHRAMGYQYDDEPAPLVPFSVQPPTLFPKWQHVPQVYRHMHHAPMTMFELSPEDKAAGGHDQKN